jgi:hypothetical protein
MGDDKRFVYVLRNGDHDPRFYVGLTSDVEPGSPTTTPAAAGTPHLIGRGTGTSSSSFPMRQRPFGSNAI